MANMKILAVGDVFIDREKPETAFKHVRSLFEDADVVFGNCEGVYSHQWERAPSSGVPLIADPIGVKALAEAHFTVMSLANNHSLDGGFKALLATYDMLETFNIAATGAGKDVNAAHRPALIERAGMKIAILAYTSVFPHGYEARGKVPGLAALRAHTLYTPWEINEWNPGLLPKVTTVPHEQDHKVLKEDIVKAKEIADIVLVSVHWGDFTRPFVLTDHERRTARFAIDAGADAIFGHHHHLIRGIEYYKKKPIFYGLGHFAFDLPRFQERLEAEGYLVGSNPIEEIALSRRFGDYRLYPRDEYPLLPFHPEARLTFVASLEFSDGGFNEISVIPCIIDTENSPRPLYCGDPQADLVLKYLRKNCDLEYLPTDIAYNKNHKDGLIKFQILSKANSSA
jgi:poly-gamma-glutamate synthesis protein (capsule biosynthesis protein)